MEETLNNYSNFYLYYSVNFSKCSLTIFKNSNFWCLFLHIFACNFIFLLFIFGYLCKDNKETYHHNFQLNVGVSSPLCLQSNHLYTKSITWQWRRLRRTSCSHTIAPFADQSRNMNLLKYSRRTEMGLIFFWWFILEII